MGGGGRVVRNGELGNLEAEILEMLVRIHFPIATRSPDGSEDWRAVTTWELSKRLTKNGQPISMGTSLANLVRKGFVRRERRAEPGMRRALHWQITVAGCAAVMRRRQAEDA